MTIKQQRIGLALAIVAAPLFGWLVFGRSSEPRYLGKRVSYWFKEYCYLHTEQPYYNDDDARAEDAFQKFGTNALPYLLARALDTNDDPAARKAFREFFDEVLPRSRHRPRYVSQDVSRDRSVYLIEMMQPAVNMVLPALSEALTKTNTLARRQAVSILGATASSTNQPEVVAPLLGSALGDPDRKTAAAAIYGLSRLGSNAVGAVPDLILALERSPPTNAFRNEYVDVLGRCGTNATPVLPVLRRLFQSETNVRDHTFFAAALLRINEEETGAFAYLTNCLTNHADEKEISSAAWRIYSLGLRAQSAIPALLEDLSTTNYSVWSTVYRTLTNLGTPDSLLLPRLRDNLNSTNEDLRIGAAVRLVTREDFREKALSVILQSISEQSRSQFEAIDMLGNIPLSATNALPVLLKSLDGTNVAGWGYIPQAITNLGGALEPLWLKLEEKIAGPTVHAEYENVILALTRIVLERDPSDRRAQLDILRLHDSQAPTWEVIQALGMSQPALPEVMAALRKDEQSEDFRIRRAAKMAIVKIEDAKTRKNQ